MVPIVPRVLKNKVSGWYKVVVPQYFFEGGNNQNTKIRTKLTGFPVL